jgi:hypothetical protein
MDIDEREGVSAFYKDEHPHSPTKFHPKHDPCVDKTFAGF